MKAILSFIIITWMVSNCFADPPDWQPITGAQYAMVVMAEIIHNDLTFNKNNGLLFSKALQKLNCFNFVA